MININIKKATKYVFLSLGIIAAVGIVILVLLIVLIILGYMQSGKSTAQIQQDFPKEVTTVPGLVVNRFDVNSWDGYSYASITIPGKGIVEMDYESTGKFSLWRIGDYSLRYSCGYTTWLYHGSPYLKWFPEVDSFLELTEKYDEIIASIKKLPTTPDENYRVYHKDRDIFHPFTKIGCDLVQKKITE